MGSKTVWGSLVATEALKLEARNRRNRLIFAQNMGYEKGINGIKFYSAMSADLFLKYIDGRVRLL